MVEENLFESIKNQKSQLKQQIIDIQKELKSVNTDHLMQDIYCDWLTQIHHDQQNQDCDNDMGFIIFVYSLILNDSEYNTSKTDPEVIMELIGRLKDIFNDARIVGNFPDLPNMSDDMLIKRGVYDHYKIYKSSREIYGIMAYLYQLIEYLEFLIVNFDNDIIKEKGYSLKILKIMHNKVIMTKKKLYGNQSLTNEQRLNLALSLYTNFSILDTWIPCTTPVDENSKKLGIENYTEYVKWYNVFIKDFSCKLGDNNNNYIFPSDPTILLQKPFIIQPDNTMFYINPFFAEVGLPMHLKYFDRWLIDTLKEKYTTKKGKFIENKTYTLLCKIFGEENCYYDMYYSNESNHPVQLEIFVHYGNFILYFECKSNSIREKASKSSIDYYCNLDDKGFLKKVSKQINNTYSLFQNNTVKIFKTARLNPDEKITINTKNNFIFIPTVVTFSSFEHLSGQSQELKKILKSWADIENTPLIMSIFELESICNLLDTQYLFIDYILQRHHAINTPNNPFFSQVGTDELVQLGHYIQTSYIPFLTLRYENVHSLGFDASWQNEIDLYFGETIVPEGMTEPKKPKLELDTILLEFIEWTNATKRFKDIEKPHLLQWSIVLFNHLNNSVEPISEFINTYYKNLFDSTIDSTYYRTRAGLLKSRFSEKDEPTMLFSFSLCKSVEYHGKCNIAYCNDKFKQFPSLVKCFCVSYNIHGVSIEDRFKLFCCLPTCSPYEYFDIKP